MYIRDTYPKVIVSSQIDDTSSGDSSSLIDPGTLQCARLPDTNQASRVETKVDAIAGPLHHGGIVGPAVAGAGSGVGVAGDRADESCGRGHEAGEAVEEHGSHERSKKLLFFFSLLICSAMGGHAAGDKLSWGFGYTTVQTEGTAVSIRNPRGTLFKQTTCHLKDSSGAKRKVRIRYRFKHGDPISQRPTRSVVESCTHPPQATLL